MQYYRYFVIVMLLSLVGCSYSNPLNAERYPLVAKTLRRTAIHAEKTLGYDKKMHDAGGYFQMCLDSSEKKKLPSCQALFQAMLKRLRHQKAYRGLAMSNLEDNQMWTYVRFYYRIQDKHQETNHVY